VAASKEEVLMTSTRTNVIQTSSSRKALDSLTTILAQLGPPPDTSRKDYSTASSAKGSNQLFIEFMSRMEGRNVESIKELKVFYEGGTAKVFD
jgi:neurofibromin 1